MGSLEQLTHEVARTIGDGPDPGRRARQRRAIAQLSRRPRPRAHAWWFVPLTISVLLLLAWSGRLTPRSPTAWSGDRPFAAGAWISAADEPLRVDFADRSHVSLAPGAATHLVEADPHRVQLALDHGRLDVTVEPDTTRAWLVVAGPYTVAVTGTEFSVDWQPPTLTVAVTRGRVHVHGGTLTDTGRRLSAGEHLRWPADPREPIDETLATPALAPPSPVVPAKPTGTTPRNEPTWRDRIAAGEHAAALERDGFTAVVARVDADDLDRIAHSARLARQPDRARAALEALRRRFPRDSRTDRATFLLGVIAADLDSDPQAAAASFTAYLRDHPDGAFAQESRERLLRLWRDAGDHTRAQSAARDYLQHHPDKPLAELAREILREP
jgi:hypothetical protein